MACHGTTVEAICAKEKNQRSRAARKYNIIAVKIYKMEYMLCLQLSCKISQNEQIKILNPKMNIITSYPYFCFIGEINEILRITAHCMMSNIRRKSGDASIQSVQVNAIQI